MKLIKKGITRWVLLTDNYAIKFPSPAYKLRFLVNGFLCNRDEIRKTRTGSVGICPVKYVLLFGIISVMCRCRVLNYGEIPLNILEKHPAIKIGSELKEDSFGYMPKTNELVSVDYADWTKRGSYNGDPLVSFYVKFNKSKTKFIHFIKGI